MSNHGRPVKVVHAVRVAAPPTIDGRLDDEPWIVAPAAVDLTQRDPDNGQAMTMVTLAFDPRHDHQTGYAFQTNPSGWQGDFTSA